LNRQLAKLLRQSSELKIFIMARKDHPHVKNDDKYEALRDKGMSKERAAKISNSKDSSKRGGEHSHGGKRKS
jgi:hypothetical protein